MQSHIDTIRLLCVNAMNKQNYTTDDYIERSKFNDELKQQTQTIRSIVMIAYNNNNLSFKYYYSALYLYASIIIITHKYLRKMRHTRLFRA